MRFKKTWWKLMAVVLLISVIGAAHPAITAAAAEATAVVDYAKYQLVITPGSSDNYVFVEISKKGGKDFKATATYSYVVAELRNSAGKIAVDLSFLQANKEQYVRVYGDKTANIDAVKDITIAAQPDKLTIKYTSGQKTLAEALAIKQGGEIIALSAAKLATYEYKSLYGSTWALLSTFDYKAAEIAGTTILIHECQSANPSKPVGVDVKVKIKAAAKAPKVTVDYMKGTIKFPKNTEWVKLGNNFAQATVPQESKLSISDLKGIVPGDKIAVRTKATEKSGASNIAVVSIPKVTEIAVEKDGSGAITAIVEKSNAANRITWMAKEEEVLLAAVGSSFDYSTDGKSWKTVKAGGNKKLKYESDKLELYFRKSGVKANAEQEGCFPSVASDKVTITKPTATSGGTKK